MTSSLDAGIPLLTEIVISPRVEAPVTPATIDPVGYAAPMVPVTPAVPTTPLMAPAAHAFSTAPKLSTNFDSHELISPIPIGASNAAAPVELHRAASAEEWEQMEINISERITRQVLSRIDFVLEQRVRDSLADVLQLAVEGLALDIKRGLHQTLEDVISRAVAQEMARLQTSKI